VAAAAKGQSRAAFDSTREVYRRTPGAIKCKSCDQPLRAEKATWACGCGAWAFRASFDHADGEADWHAMVTFLDEAVLGIPQAFDALSSQLSARRPLRGRVGERTPIRHATSLPHPPPTPADAPFRRGRVWIVVG
jgi:hypothetical protein